MHGGGGGGGGRRAGREGWSETIDLIMHACSLIHCNGGKGSEGEGGEDQ